MGTVVSEKLAQRLENPPPVQNRRAVFVGARPERGKRAQPGDGKS